MDSASLLSAGRAAFENITRGYGRIGLSANSRQQLEGFYNNAAALFNQLYTASENQEVNNVTIIKALRSKYDYLVSESIKSETSGTKVDTEA
jgi:hypothetical protein